MIDDRSLEQASGQVDRAQALLDASLPDHGEQLDVHVDESGDSIRLAHRGTARDPESLRLFAGGGHLANLVVSMRFRWKAHLEALVLDESRFTLSLTTDRQPLLRFEFQEALTSTPQSHWHLHAERGAFSALLSRTRDRGTGRRDAARLSSLHFPLGGPHFRPSLADVTEFLIVECGVDARPGWERAVHEYRKHWRREEAAATARQFPAETAAALQQLGWQVRSPVPDGLPAPFVSLLTA